MLEKPRQLRHWNSGVLQKAKNCFFSVIPSFRYSIIPLFHCATVRVVLALLVLGAPGTVHADFWEMASRFQAYISAQEEYSDNIDLSPDHGRGDFITTISPGLKFSTRPRTRVPAGEFKQTPGEGEENFSLEGDYHPGFVFYAKNSDRNYVSHAGTLNGSYTWDRNLTFRVREYLIRSEEPRESEYSQNAIPGQYLLGTQRNRAIYLRNVFEPSLEYKFGKENLLFVGYQNNVYDTQSSTGQNSREDSLTPRITYWFDVRNGASLEYNLMLGHFEGSPFVVAHFVSDKNTFLFGGIQGTPDLVGHSLKGRYTYRFDPHTSFFGEYTFQLRDFDAPGVKTDPPTFPPPPPPPSLDYVVHVPTVGIEHTFSSTLSGRAQLGYFFQVRDQGSTQSGPSYSVLITRRGERTSVTLSLQGGYTEDFFSAENRGFTKSHSAIGTVSHNLAAGMTAGLTGSFQRTESEPNRKDNVWQVSGNMSYQVLRWLGLSLSLSHLEDRSNVSKLDYSENRGVFIFTATY